MNGQSFPTGAADAVAARLVQRPGAREALLRSTSPRRKKLLADAGYPDGFEVQLDCPNNRYVNDEQICIALAGMWAQIKVKVKVVGASRARPTSRRLEKYDFSMYMLGWGGSVTDAETTLTPVMRNNLGEKGVGFYNYGRSRNDKLDALAAQSSTEADPKKREELDQGGAARVQGAVHDAAAAPPGDPVGGARERRTSCTAPTTGSRCAWVTIGK